MKQIKILLITTITSLFILNANVNAQNKTTPVSMEVLTAREDLLKESTKLNKLKIKLSDSKEKVVGLEKDLEKANERSTKSAVDSKQLSIKASENAGDNRLANKASREAKSAYRDAKNAQKLANRLNSEQRKIKSYESDIEKLKAKIEMMDQQLKFIDTTRN